VGLSRVVPFAAVLVTVLAVVACTPAPAPPPAGSRAPSSAEPTPTTSTAPPASSKPAPVTPTPRSAPRPWVVGARPLPLRPDGYGQVLPTPRPLVNRRLPTVDRLPPPRGDRYESTTGAVPAAVLARSTWHRDCPVAAGELRYLTMSFRGFDGRAHTGEMIVHRSAAAGVTRVFRALYAARFPIEEMRVVARAELDAPPTGDGDNTTAFVCRAATGLRRWSAHAYGLAVDVNPFHNPYVRGDLVLPELASSYVDRDWRRPGMIAPGDAVVRAFAAIGWSWGGDWSDPVDLQHFSATGN
jgi:hypothetical protein